MTQKAIYIYIYRYVICGHNLRLLYREYSKQYIKEERRQERTKLAKAWNIIDSDGFGHLSIEDKSLLGLMKILRPKVSYGLLL